jgi:putative SOS response-associated peptidase YedK
MQSNAPEEVYTGTPGMMVTESEGVRGLRSMVWGFPLRLKGMKPEAKPKPVNNIGDLAKGMWIGLARKPQWRCLIPVTGFAEAEGVKGRMTRTGFSLKDQPVYSGVVTDANEAIQPVHNRMPLLLHADEYEQCFTAASTRGWHSRSGRFRLNS